MYGSPSPSLKFASGVGRVSRMAEATLSENIIRPKSVPPLKPPPPPSPPSPQLCRTALSKHAKCGRVQRDSDVAGHDTRQIRIRQILKWTGAAAGMRAYAALERRNLRNGLGRPPRSAYLGQNGKLRLWAAV